MKKAKKYNRIAVFGAGLWGSALANHVSRDGAPVLLWEYFPALAEKLQKTRRHPNIPKFQFNPSIRVVSDMKEAVKDVDTVLIVLPSSHVRKTARQIRPILEGAARRPVVINASKGVEPESLRTMGEVLLEEMPFIAGKIYTLSGPSFAREVARGVPTKLVLAGPKGTHAAAAIRLLNGGAIRIEYSRDRIGVELGGSLKNVLAIGCGMLDGLKAGDNTRAALMTQGIAEMGYLISGLGGRRETIYGLAGIGDLILTGSSPESRNYTLGQKLGKGKGLQKALSEISTVVEGVESSMSTHTLIKASHLKAPLIEAIWRVIYRDARPESIIDALGFDSGKK